MKKLLLLSLFLGSFVLSGCMKIDISQEVYENGVTKTKSSYDLTKLNSLKEAGLAGTGADDTASKICSDNNLIKTGDFISYKCNVLDKNHVVIENEIDLVKSKSFYKENGVYIYKAGNEINLDNNDNDFKIQPKSKEEIEEMERSKKMLIAMGFELSATIKMPGIVVKTDIGRIESGYVVIDIDEMFRLASLTGHEYYIVSKEPNVTDSQVEEVLNKFKRSFDTQKDKSSNKQDNNKIVTSENDTNYLKQLETSASAIKKAGKGKYIAKIDNFVEKTNNEKLKVIFDKIQKIKSKTDKIQKFKKHKDLLNYLEAKIYLKLNK